MKYTNLYPDMHAQLSEIGYECTAPQNPAEILLTRIASVDENKATH